MKEEISESPESHPGSPNLLDGKLSEGQQEEGVTLRNIGRFKAHEVLVRTSLV